MSINSCSINEYTLNTLCGRRRQAIIDSLLNPPAPVTGGGSQQHVHPDTKVPLNIFRRNERDSERDVVDTATLELEYMQVTIEMQGQQFSQTIQRDNNVPLVSVHGMTMKDRMEEQVNIADFKIRIL
jgi:hypothetical protein